MTKGSGKGKNKSAKLEVRPFMVKNYLWVFVNSMINNPTFDSQVTTAHKTHFIMHAVTMQLHATAILLLTGCNKICTCMIECVFCRLRRH